MADEQSGEFAPDVGETPAPPGTHAWAFKNKTSVAGRYAVVEPLLHGKLGEVYRVLTDGPRTPMNMRWIPGVAEDAVSALASLTALPSRHLLNVVDFKALDGGAIVVTEPYRRTLRGRLDEHGRALPAEEAGQHARDVLHALATLEELELVPLVVSPESIALWDDGAALDEYYLTRLFPPSNLPLPIDRAPYLAPDMDPLRPDSADALYGLGATLYEMLVGKPHLNGDAPFILIGRAGRRDYAFELQGPLAAYVQRLLTPVRHERFASARAALEALETPMSVVGPDTGVPVHVRAGDAGRGAPAGAEGTGPALERAGPNEQGYEVWIRRPDDVRMILIPGGTFRMGSDRGREFKRKNESPAIEVRVGPFLIDETPVTWGILERLLSRAASHDLVLDRKHRMPPRFGGNKDQGFNDRWYDLARSKKDLVDEIDENHPVIMVQYEEARALAALLGLRLPVEAQWEYAYRGGTATEYYWGNEPDSQQAWFHDNSEGRPQAVGQMPRNPVGLLDMAGNVAEFCRDGYVKDLYEQVATPGNPSITAEVVGRGVTGEGDRFSLRGGSWDSSVRAVRAAFRADVLPDVHSPTNGFRFVIDGDDPPEWARSAFGGAVVG